MSCQMTETKEIARLANYVASIIDARNRSGVLEGVKRFDAPDALMKALSKEIDMYGYADPRAIYSRLYALNRVAYEALYGKEMCDNDIPAEPPEMPCVTIDTKEVTRSDWQLRLYFLLRYFVYQCYEGEVAKNPLFLALDELSNKIAEVMAFDAARAANLQWGEWD